MGLLERFRTPTPRPNLVEAVETVEQCVERLAKATDRLEVLVEILREERSREAKRA